MPGPLSNYINTPNNNANLVPTGKSLSEYVNGSQSNSLFDTGKLTIDQSAYLPYTNLLSGQSFDINRALGQSNWEQFGNLLKRGSAKALLTIPESIGYLGDIPEMLGLVDSFDNSLSNWAQEQKRKAEANNPDYSAVLHQDAGSFDPGSFDWWMRNGDSIIESLGYFIPGGVVGKLAGSLLKTLSVGARTAEFASALTSATAMNYVETMQIAGDAYKNMLQSGATKEEAAKQASELVWQGKLTIITEMPQYLSLMRGFGEMSSRSMKGITKSVAKDVAREYSKQFGAEGAEEIYQGHIQAEAQRSASIASGKMKDDGSTKLQRFWNYFTSDQGLTEGFLGGIGGLAFQGAVDGVSKATEMFKGKPNRSTAARGEVKSNMTDLISFFNEGVKNAEDKKVAAESDNINGAEIAEQKEFLTLAMRKALTGTYKSFLNTMDQLSSMTEEEAAKNGITDLAKAKEQLAKYKIEAINFEKIYNQVQSTFSGKSDTIKESALNALYNKGVLVEQISKLNKQISDIYADPKNLRLNNQNLHLLNLQKVALKRDLSFLERLENKDEANAGYQKFIEQKLKEVDEKIAFQKEYDKDKSFSPNNLYLPGDIKTEKLGLGEDVITKNLVDINRNEYQIKELSKRFEYLKTEKAEKEAKAKEKEADKFEKERQEKLKAERERKPYDDMVTKALDPNTRVSTADKTNIQKAFEIFQTTDSFKNLSEEDKAKLIQNHTKAIEAIDDKMLIQSGSPEGIDHDTTQEMDEESMALVASAFKAKLGKGDVVTKNLTEEDAGKENLESNKLANARTDDTDENGKFRIRKKDEVLTFAYLNVDYIIDNSGAIVDVTDGKDLKVVTPDDERLYDYKEFTPGTEFQIVLDTDFATKNNIPIDKDNIHRIPFGIKLKDGPITAWIHRLDSKPKEGEIDKRIQDLIRPPRTEEEFDVRKIAQDNLIKLREHLFKSIVENKESVTGKVELNKSRGYVHFGVSKSSLEAFGDGKTIAKDIYFGVIDEKGFVKTTDDRIYNEYAIEQLPNVDKAKEFSGALVVLLPNNSVDATRTSLTPQFLSVPKLSEDDVDTALDIIYNYTTQEDVAKIKNLPDSIKTTEDLLNLLVFNGKNSKNFHIVKIGKKRILKTTAFVTGNKVLWDEKSAIEITDENKEKIREFLKTKYYNIRINNKVTYQPVSTKGVISLVKVKNDIWIATHSTTTIDSRPIGNTGRKQFFFQPLIPFTVSGFTTNSQTEQILNAVKQIKSKKEVKEDDDALPNPIIVDEEPLVINNELPWDKPKEDTSLEAKKAEDLDNAVTFIINDGTYGGSKDFSLREALDISAKENGKDYAVKNWTYLNINGTGVFYNITTGTINIVPNNTYNKKSPRVFKIFIDRATNRLNFSSRVINTPNLKHQAETDKVNYDDLLKEIESVLEPIDKALAALEGKKVVSENNNIKIGTIFTLYNNQQWKVVQIVEKNKFLAVPVNFQGNATQYSKEAILEALKEKKETPIDTSSKAVTIKPTDSNVSSLAQEGYNSLTETQKKWLLKNIKSDVDIFKVLESDTEGIKKIVDAFFKFKDEDLTSEMTMFDFVSKLIGDNLVETVGNDINLSNRDFLNNFNGIKDKTQYVLSTLIGLENEDDAQLAYKLYSLLAGKNIDFELVENDSNIVATAVYGDTLKIKINSRAFIRSKRDYKNILLHEILHFATGNALVNPVTAEEKEFSEGVNELFEYAKTNLEESYGLTNIKEFISEAFSNPEFKERLKALPYNKKGRSNIFARFIDFLSKLFGIKRQSIYDLVYNYTNKFLKETKITTTGDRIEDNIYEIYLENNIPLGYVSELLSNINYLAIYDLRSNPKISQDELYDLVRRRLKGALNRLEENRLTSTEAYRVLSLVLDNKGDNPLYKDLVDKSKIYIQNQVSILRDFTTEGELPEFATEDVSKGKEGYGKDAFELNPKDSASKRLKYRLSFTPNAYFDENGMAKPKQNVFGMQSFVPFDAMYNTIINLLSDKPSSEFLGLMEKIAQYNPAIALFYRDLINSSTSEKLNDQSYYKEFLSHFQKQKAKFLNVIYKIGDNKEIDNEEVYIDYDDISDEGFGAPKTYYLKTSYANDREAADLQISDWYDKFRYGNLIKYEDGVQTIDKDKVKVLQARFNEAANKKLEESLTDIVENILPEFGIQMSDSVVSLMIDDPKMIGDFFTIKAFMTSTKRIIDRFAGEGSKEKGSEYSQFGNDNAYLYQTNDFRLLANINLITSGTLFSSMYRNEEGKNIYTIFNNTLLSKSFQALTDKSSEKFQNYLRSDYHKNNRVIQAIENEEKGFVYDLAYFSTFSEEGKALSGTSFMSLSPQDREYVRFSMFLNNANSIGFFQAPTMSDKPTIPLIRTNKIIDAFSNNTLSGSAKTALLNGIKAEHERIFKVRRQVKEAEGNPEAFKSLIENYHYTLNKDGSPNFEKAQGLLYHFFPSLNTLKVNLTDDVTTLLNTEEDISKHEETIVKHIEEIVKNEIQVTKDKYTDYGFLIKGVFTDKIDDPRIGNIHKDILSDYVVNYMIQYMTFYQLFSNDLAFAKGYLDMSKRNAGILAPGQDFAIEGLMNTVILNDVYYPSTSLSTLYNSLVAMFKIRNYDNPEKRAEEIVKNYTKTNNTDAQGYVSLDEYERWLDGLGRLDADMRDIIAAVRHGDSKSLTNEQLNKVLQPFKPVYVEDVWDNINEVFVRKYIKLSVIPLFEELTLAYPELDNIRKQMESKKIGMLAYRSASKLGSQYVENFYGNESQTQMGSIPESSIQKLPYSGLRLQQELPYDISKEEINTVSQARKLIFQDLTDSWFGDVKWDFYGKELNARELYSQHENLHIANVNEKFRSFADEFGLTVTTETETVDGEEVTKTSTVITNIDKVNKLLLKEALARGYSDNSQMALQLTDDGKNFVIPMWFTPQSEQFETLLLSVINSKIVKQKHQGESFVQVSNQGFAKENIQTEIPNLEGIEWIGEDAKAKFTEYMKKPALLSVEVVDGKLTPEQILLPNVFKKYFKGKRTISYSELKEAGLLKMFAMRIPNQGHNSMASVEVAGFLPEIAGDIVVVHQDMLKRMGSDFDVDKLYVYYYNVEETPAGYSKIQYLSEPKDFDKRWALYQERILKSKATRDLLKKEGIDLDLIQSDQVSNEMAARLFKITGDEYDDILAILAEEKLAYTLEEFKQLPIERQNSREARENAILDIYFEIFSHPEILLKMTIPNSVEPLREANDHFDDKESAKVNLPLSVLVQDDLFESNSSGKIGIGITSLWNTFHSQLQYHKVNLKLYYLDRDREYQLITSGVKFLNENGELIGEKFHAKQTQEVEDKIWDILEKRSGNQIPKEYRRFGLYRLGKTKGRAKFDYISILLQVLQSAAVDNAKEQELNKANLNSDTFNVACYLAAIGVDDFKLIVGFLRQPAVIDFVKSLVKRKTKTKDYFEKGTYAEQAYNETFANLILRLRELKHLPKPHVTDLNLIKAFSLSDLEKGIALSNVENKNSLLSREQLIDHYEQQIEILKAFYNYKDQADSLAKSIGAYNIDVKGVGKAWYEVNSAIQRLKVSGMIPSEFSNAYFSGLRSLSKDTLPGTLIEKAFFPALEVYNTEWLFPYGKGLFKQIFTEVFPILGKGNPTENDYKTLRKHFLTFIASDENNGLFGGRNISDYRNELLNSDSENNIAKRLVKFKQELPNNYLLNRLTVSTKKLYVNNKIEKVDFAKQKVEKSEEPYVIQAFIELLYNANPEIAQFGKDLVAYSYLSDGVGQSMAGISHLIPIQYLVEKGFGEYYRVFNPTSDNDKLRYRFISQFVRNRPDILKKRSIKGVNIQSNRAYLSLENAEDGLPMFAKWDAFGTEKIYAFEDVLDNKAVYIELEPLGLGNGFIEMNINEESPRSIVERNRTSGDNYEHKVGERVNLDTVGEYVNFEVVTEDSTIVKNEQDLNDIQQEMDQESMSLVADAIKKKLSKKKEKTIEEDIDMSEKSYEIKSLSGELSDSIEALNVSDEQKQELTDMLKVAKTEKEFGEIIKKICTYNGFI